MKRALRVWNVASLVLVLAAIGCGASPAVRDTRPGGALVVVVRQGPDRVPFRPAAARIAQANARLAELLGHSVTIEVDGALFPQGREAAEELIAHLVEDAARDVAALRDERPGALAYAQAHFERLVVRYDPAEAARREPSSYGRRHASTFDPATSTVDVVRAEARFRAVETGEIAAPLYRAWQANDEGRYARVLPSMLPRSEHRAWLTYHAHGEGHPARLAGVDVITVRGALELVRGGDAELAKEARGWLFERGVDELASAYRHHAPEIDAAAPGSPLRVAETEIVAWLRGELPRLSLAERDALARHLWIIDFRKPDGGDRFATNAFPGLDPMDFALQTVDAWIAAGHPFGVAAFDRVVDPVKTSTVDGERRYDTPGPLERTFYRWAVANGARESRLAEGMIARRDTPFALAAFHAVHVELHEEAAYLRFLRRFEAVPELWRVGAEVHRVVDGGGNVSPVLVDEARRLWRDVPAARGHALYWFAVQADHSYDAARDWKDDLRGQLAEPADLAAFLELGWPAFALLPAAWPALPKRGRVAAITAAAPALLAADIHPYPGRHGVAGTLSDVARLLCQERSSEAAELRAFALAEQPRRPGAGLVEVANDAACGSSSIPRASRPPRAAKKPGAGADMKDPW